MPPVTRIALRALEKLGGPRVLLAAVPGGIAHLARVAGVSEGRVSQVLRQEPLPRAWAELIAGVAGFSVPEVYVQLGQAPVGSPLGPLFDSEVEPPAETVSSRQPAQGMARRRGSLEGPLTSQTRPNSKPAARRDLARKAALGRRGE